MQNAAWLQKISGLRREVKLSLKRARASIDRTFHFRLYSKVFPQETCWRKTMTGREKIEAALSREGTSEFPAAMCYHGIYLRDHWDQLTKAPWWTKLDPNPEKAIGPWIEMIEQNDEDWFPAHFGFARSERREREIEATAGSVYRVNKITGERQLLHRPPPGGDLIGEQGEGAFPAKGIANVEDLDKVIAATATYHLNPKASADDGCMDLPRGLISKFGAEKLPMSALGTPYWRCYLLWGFEEMMVGLMEFPELIEHACRRFTEDMIRFIARCKAAGIGIVWLEDCMSDMMSPPQWRKYNLTYLRQITDAARAAGIYTVHYFCGKPDGKWDLLLDTGADALSLEESKKNFEINIEEVAERVNGKMALFGNVDSIGVMEQGTEEQIKLEIARQCKAGRRNRNRFVVGFGSPITPKTPPSRVRLFCDTIHGPA
jgi:hypothetical protein